MTDCRQIESLLPPYVDGEVSSADRRTVDSHLAGCAPCRASVVAQQSIRVALREAAPELRPGVPPGLRTRVAATLVEASSPASIWPMRVARLAAAAAVVLAVSIGAEMVSPNSNVLFAAQLAIDHVRCFVVELGSTSSQTPEAVSAFYAEGYGWDIPVPPSNAEAGVTLVAARRCPYWLGDHAHLLYRSGDQELSLYVTPRDERPHGELAVLGHIERIWTGGGYSFALVARGVPQDRFSRVAAYLEGATTAAVAPRR